MSRPALLLVALSLLIAGCGGTAPQSLTERALQEWRSGQYDKAIATSTEAIREDPESVKGYLYRGRAYQLRNAMGDSQRAIADFSEAIRLAPDSPDAYYYRAIVYRELGQDELATADDQKARLLDEEVKKVFRRMPDITQPPTTPESAVAGAEEADGEDVKPPKSLGDELADRLRESAGGGDDGEAAFRETFSERYDRAAKERAEREARAAAEEQDAAGLGGEEDALLPQPQLGVAPGAVQGDDLFWSPTPPTMSSGALGSRAAQQQQPVDRAPIPSLQSPFGQRPPAPTGYVDPSLSNPFAAPQPGQQGLGQSQTQVQSPFRQTPRPSVPTTRPPSTRYTNPSVRPPNPRDYIP
ncbi:MAG: tetratricopeptide repeat protein [Planctomycetota bacterium]|mgnify:CR=1 FL=1|nr:MAG: tetratricopeptide repeat protein [Planctomycetota bacterium]